MVWTPEPAQKYLAERRRLLRELEERGPQPLGAVPRVWPVTTHHVRMLLRELEHDRLVERVRSADGAYLYRLTDEGERTLELNRRPELAQATGPSRA